MPKWINEQFATTSRRARSVGVLMLVGSFVLTVILAVRATSESATALENVLLGIFAAGLQIGAGIKFMSVGKADPMHAKSSVAHLVSLGSTATKARKIAEDAMYATTMMDRKIAIGQLSVYLSEIEEKASLAVKDWTYFHGEAVADILPNRAAEDVTDV